MLDEECHDCAGWPASPSPVPAGVLADREVNVPTDRAPSPGVDVDWDTRINFLLATEMEREELERAGMEMAETATVEMEGF